MATIHTFPLIHDKHWSGIERDFLAHAEVRELTEAQREAFILRMRGHFDWLSEPQKIAGISIDGDLIRLAEVKDIVQKALELQASAYREQQLTRNSWLLARFLEIEIELARLR